MEIDTRWPWDVRERFLKEYSPHVQALENYYSRMVVKLTRTTIGPENTVVQEMEGKCDQGRYLITMEGKNYKNSTHEMYFHNKAIIDGCNPLYSFTVVSKGEGRYAARDITLPKEGEKKSLWTMSVPFADHFRQMTYLDVAKNQDTNFLAFEDRIWQKEPVKVLRTEYTDMFKNRVAAEYYFSPEKGWLCRGQRLGTTGASQYVEETYSYEPKEGEPIPALKRIEQWVHDDKDPAKTHKTMFTEVSDFRHAGPFPESDFRLTAFGLPEPAQPKSPSWWPLWASYTLGAIGLAIVAVLFALLAHRSRKVTVQPKKNICTPHFPQNYGI